MAAAGPRSSAARQPTRRLAEERNRERRPRVGGRSEHETVDARVEIPQRPELLAQLVDASVLARFDHALTLPASARHEGRQIAQPVSAPPEWFERAIGGLTELQRELPRAIDAAERDEGGLLDVLAHGLAGFRRIPFDVEQIIDDLKRQAEVFRVRGQRSARRPPGARDDRARCRRRAEERAGLTPVDPFERVES